MMSWVLTASGSLAGHPGDPAGSPAPLVQDAQRRIERTEVVDPDSGAVLCLTGRKGSALRASLVWSDLDVSKVVHPGGDFEVRVASDQDVLLLVRTGARLRVTRSGQTAAVQLDRSDEVGLDQVQLVLAGSRAMRAFRRAQRQLTQESRESAPGVAMENLDTLLGILQGEPGATDRRKPAAREAGWRLSRVACNVGPTCYAEYEGEVVLAWDDFSQCIDDVRWFPGLQEVCAFTWLLRVESAWFRFIGCSSFPIKAT
jgi:hypothetical protein